jgi:hypothetical protein
MHSLLRILTVVAAAFTVMGIVLAILSGKAG